MSVNEGGNGFNEDALKSYYAEVVLRTEEGQRTEKSSATLADHLLEFPLQDQQLSFSAEEFHDLLVARSLSIKMLRKRDPLEVEGSLVHPGEILKAECLRLGWDLADLADSLFKVSYDQIHTLFSKVAQVSKNAKFTKSLAMLVGALGGTSELPDSRSHRELFTGSTLSQLAFGFVNPCRPQSLEIMVFVTYGARIQEFASQAPQICSLHLIRFHYLMLIAEGAQILLKAGLTPGGSVEGLFNSPSPSRAALSPPATPAALVAPIHPAAAVSKPPGKLLAPKKVCEAPRTSAAAITSSCYSNLFPDFANLGLSEVGPVSGLGIPTSSRGSVMHSFLPPPAYPHETALDGSDDEDGDSDSSKPMPFGVHGVKGMHTTAASPVSRDEQFFVSSPDAAAWASGPLLLNVLATTLARATSPRVPGIDDLQQLMNGSGLFLCTLAGPLIDLNRVDAKFLASTRRYENKYKYRGNALLKTKVCNPDGSAELALLASDALYPYFPLHSPNHLLAFISSQILAVFQSSSSQVAFVRKSDPFTLASQLQEFKFGVRLILDGYRASTLDPSHITKWAYYARFVFTMWNRAFAVGSFAGCSSAALQSAWMHGGFNRNPDLIPLDRKGPELLAALRFLHCVCPHCFEWGSISSFCNNCMFTGTTTSRIFDVVGNGMKVTSFDAASHLLAQRQNLLQDVYVVVSADPCEVAF